MELNLQIALLFLSRTKITVSRKNVMVLAWVERQTTILFIFYKEVAYNKTR